MGADAAICVSQSSHELRKAAVFSSQVLGREVIPITGPDGQINTKVLVLPSMHDGKDR